MTKKGKEILVPYQVQQFDIVSNSNKTATPDSLMTTEEKTLPYQVQRLDIVLVSDNEAALIVR